MQSLSQSWCAPAEASPADDSGTNCLHNAADASFRSSLQDSIVEAKKTGGNVWYEARVKSVKGGFTVVSYLGPDLGEGAILPWNALSRDERSWDGTAAGVPQISCGWPQEIVEAQVPLRPQVRLLTLLFHCFFDRQGRRSLNFPTFARHTRELHLLARVHFS